MWRAVGGAYNGGMKTTEETRKRLWGLDFVGTGKWWGVNGFERLLARMLSFGKLLDVGG